MRLASHTHLPTTVVTTATNVQTLPGWNFKGKFLVAPDGTVSDAANEGDFLAAAIEELM